MSPEFVDTDPATMTPEQIRQHTETMRRFREHDAAARSAFRFMLVLIAAFCFGCWQGWQGWL